MVSVVSWWLILYFCSFMISCVKFGFFFLSEWVNSWSLWYFMVYMCVCSFMSWFWNKGLLISCLLLIVFLCMILIIVFRWVCVVLGLFNIFCLYLRVEFVMSYFFLWLLIIWLVGIWIFVKKILLNIFVLVIVLSGCILMFGVFIENKR